MTRRFLTFACESNALCGTLETAKGTTGLLIVSGGNELRAGPWNSQTAIAEKVAAAGFPVLRFDRRGVGDSEGPNGGFESSAPDLAAALAAFRAHVPTLRRVVAYGNCDAASALMLSGGTGYEALVLANPWTFDPEPEPIAEVVEPVPAPMTPGAIRAHYLRRIADPRAWWRLLTGKVALGGLAASLADAAQGGGPQSALAARLAAALAPFNGPVALLVAERDRTGQAFRDNWDSGDARIRICPDASHSFVEPQARLWLQGQLLAALRGIDPPR